jgi:hypothetical protein
LLEKEQDMSDSFDIGRTGALLAVLLMQSGPPLLLRDPSGRTAHWR